MLLCIQFSEVPPFNGSQWITEKLQDKLPVEFEINTDAQSDVCISRVNKPKCSVEVILIEISINFLSYLEMRKNIEENIQVRMIFVFFLTST